MIRELMIKLLFRTNRLLGSWPVRLVGYIVSTGYLFHRQRRRASLNLYQALFPQRGRIYHFYCTWRRFMLFADILADTIKVKSKGRLEFTAEGGEYVDKAAVENGGIFLMSHFGAWEIAANMLHARGHRMMILMGQRAANRLSSVQKKDMVAAGLKIMVIDEASGSPLEMLEMVRFMREGGLVSSSGDVAWTPGVRSVPVRFLNSEILFPATPHFLAMVTRVPLLTMFTCRLGRGRYHQVILPSRYVRPESRKERDKAILESAQQYASDLETMVRRFPFQWYRFDPFPGEPPPDPASDASSTIQS
jgi:predicted LPLAT superfamily acyltransferase